MTSKTLTVYNPETKIWSGPEEDYNSNVALGTYFFDFLNQQRIKNPNKVIQIEHETDDKLTIQDTYEKSVRLAVSLRELGLKAGEIVVVVSPNVPLLLPTSIAIQYLGAIANYLDESTLQQLGIEDEEAKSETPLKRVNPHFVICPPSLVENALKDMPAENILTFGENDGRFKTIEGLLEKNSKVDEQFRPVTIKEPKKVTAVMLASSGTTGKPKFLCLSHAAIMSELFRWHNYPNEGVIYNFCGMHWISGVDGVFGDLIRGKLRIITSLKLTPELFIEIIVKHQVTEMFIDPSKMILIVQLLEKNEQKLNSIKIILCAGTSVSDQLRKSILEYVPNGIVIIGYGMSEVAGMLTVCFQPKGTSVGLLVRGIQIKIQGPSKDDLGPNESGEILAKTPHDFLNYFKNEPAREEMYDEEDWFRTNDIGYFDDEGHLYIVGRKQDRLQYINHLINPVAIEALIEAHKGVTQACVVGVSVPVYNDIPTAVVQRAEGSTVTADELHEFIEDKLPNEFHKLRGGIYFIDAFPRTPTGKIKKLEVKNLAFKLYFDGKKSL